MSGTPTPSERPRPPRPAPQARARAHSLTGGRPREGATVAGRYQLEHLLGEGGMGSVWAGWDVELERPVAVKFMAPEVAGSETVRVRFNQEAKAAAGLRTRHVVDVYDYGLDDKTPFIVMERLDGEDLQRRLKRDKCMPLSEVATVITQAAKALDNAAKAGIVHRDLKPANVFLAQVDDELVVKILDFGVAKTLVRRAGSSQGTTQAGVVLGSPPYMSPEQARGKPLDGRSDLWSLAAVAYRALTGKVPYAGDSDGDVVVKLCTEKPPPASSLSSSLPAAVDGFFDKAFCHDPEGRYPNAAELARALCRAAGIESASLPGLATPPTGSAPARVPSEAPGRREPGPEVPLASGAPSAITPASWVAASMRDRSRRRLLGWSALALALAIAALAVWPRGGTPTEGERQDARTTAAEAAAPTASEPPPEIRPEEPPAADPLPPQVSASALPSASASLHRPAAPIPAPQPAKPSWGY